LEEEDVIDSRYVLEVSSPGIERPLFKEEDYQRFVGKEIQLVTIEKIDDRRKFQGLIQSFSQGILDLELEGEICRIPFEKIRRANLVHRF
jgi:ribosome maturation factor RimP